jgi:hypothetical protein
MVPKAVAVATPIPATPAPAAKPNFFSNFKSKATPAPAKNDAVKKQPFHLH